MSIRTSYLLAAGLVVAGTVGAAQAAVPAMSGPGFLNCPIQQPKAKNGTAPDVELIKKVIRCHKGEKPTPGSDGAVQVIVHQVQVGSPRQWIYEQDLGTGTNATRVWPLRVTYTVKTLYRQATETEANWMRLINVYVDNFGEWRVGSEEPIKPGTPSRTNN